MYTVKIPLTPDYHKITDKVYLKTISERIKGGPKATKISIVDHDTGEVLSENSNKIVIKITHKYTKSKFTCVVR